MTNLELADKLEGLVREMEPVPRGEVDLLVEVLRRVLLEDEIVSVCASLLRLQLR
jgi:hypothetical protein